MLPARNRARHSAGRGRKRTAADHRRAVPVMLTSTTITQVRKNEAKVGSEDIDLVDPERDRCQ
jgi:hypothetical protein